MQHSQLAPGVDIDAELAQQAAESSESSPAGPSNADDKDSPRHQRSSKSPRGGVIPTKASSHEVTLLKDYASCNIEGCKPVTDYENVEYETSDDDVGPDQLPDTITDAMQDLSLVEHALSRFHGKSSSKHPLTIISE